MTRKAHILRIEKISPNDGAGLRTVVFFKGCTMRCAWCSTPESLKLGEELCYRAAKCTACGTCASSCPNKAVRLDTATGTVVIDGAACTNCGLCAQLCPTGALSIYGKQMTVTQVMQQIHKDEIFYYHSGGGVTLSGGDVLCQPEFARDLLMACKDSGIHTMAELNMYGSYESVEMVLPYLDEYFVDLKVMDTAKHRQWTGVDNTSILENTARASAAGRPSTLHARVPLVWGINDDADNIRATANYCQSLASCAELEFLPYHRLGQATYTNIGKPYLLEDLPTMTYADAYERVAFLQSMNLPFPVKISGRLVG
ncbi:MAG: glycyl-radical enzyme activating protein [Planctomycetaceae bacterium]|nr:glycyl-radical enzyme activating protein [Planctomycetaceae bacterium]